MKINLESKRNVRVPTTQTPVLPFATTTGFFNGDMFEDWLINGVKDDPFEEFRQFLIRRDERITKHAVNEINRAIIELQRIERKLNHDQN